MAPVHTSPIRQIVSGEAFSEPSAMPDPLTQAMVRDVQRDLEAQLIQTFTLASQKMLPGIALHHLFLGTFLQCAEKALQQNGIDLNKAVPPGLDNMLRTVFTAVMNDPVLGKDKQRSTRLAPGDFFPDANNAFAFMQTGFRHTPMAVIPAQQLWRMCVNQNRVAQLAELGINMSKSALAPFLTDGEPRFCLSILEALRFSMDHQDQRLNLDFVKNLHKKLNAAGSGNMAVQVPDSRNINANLNLLSNNQSAEFDTMSETGFNLILDDDSVAEAIEEVQAFEAEVQENLRRFSADPEVVGDRVKFNISRPLCSPKTLDKLFSRWIDDYHQAMADKPEQGVRHAVVLCQKIGRIHAFQNGNGRLCHVLLNHLLSQQHAARPDPELKASNGMVALTFKSILCSSYDAMTGSVEQARLDFAAACSQHTAANKTGSARKSNAIQEAYLASR